MHRGAVVARLACVAAAVASAAVAPQRVAAAAATAGEVSSLADLGSSSNHSVNEVLQGPHRHLLGEKPYRVTVAL